MAIITDAFVAALKKVKADADNLSEAELAQLTRCPFRKSCASTF